MKKLLRVAASIEAATGLVLMIYPPFLSGLLLGAVVAGAGVALGRVVGFALLSLGLACWPGVDSADSNNPALRALFTYNLLTTLYLAYLGLDGQSVGSLLWPAVAVHAMLAFLLARAWFSAVGIEQVRGWGVSSIRVITVTSGEWRRTSYVPSTPDTRHFSDFISVNEDGR